MVAFWQCGEVEETVGVKEVTRTSVQAGLIRYRNDVWLSIHWKIHICVCAVEHLVWESCKLVSGVFSRCRIERNQGYMFLNLGSQKWLLVRKTRRRRTQMLKDNAEVVSILAGGKLRDCVGGVKELAR